MSTILYMISSFLLGVSFAWALVSLNSQYDHDPKKMLELRAECLRADTTSKYTTWCDDYAEQFSRIKK